MTPKKRAKALFADIFASSTTKGAEWVEESWAKLTDAITAAVDIEREACAKVADGQMALTYDTSVKAGKQGKIDIATSMGARASMADSIARIIRDRSKP